jgi:hypothetical protein
MKRTLSALTIASLAGALVASGGTIAASASASTVTNGPVHVFVYGDSFGVGATAVLTGAIGDSGTADSIDANGTPDSSNNTEELLDLVQGSFRVSVVGLDKKIGSAFNSFQPNHRTCSGSLSVTASVPIVAGSGTGAYAGITGGFVLTFSLAFVGPKYGSGKHIGQCNNSNSASPVAQAMVVAGSGTVSY